MKIAVEGCCHGELDAIYDTLQHLEKKNNMKVDLLLICGDFQSVRNMADMHCMAVPLKHRQMNTFYKYYSGEKVAPILTVFIGGNHEASNYLQELPYGGWVAPNIYYLGYAGVVQCGGIRIGGLSGIFKGKDFMKGHFEHPPYTEETKRSAYHVRNFDVFRLKQIKQPLDIFLTHDWPRGIYKYGNAAALKRKKQFLTEEIEKDILGNPVGADLLNLLQPDYWFSAHLHVKFAAIVQHMENDNSKITKFLALDKCLPRRQFLQVIDLPHDSNQPMKLQLDAEWLAILKSTNHMLNLSRNPQYPGGTPGERQDFSPTEAEMESVKADFGGQLIIPENFQATVPAYNPNRSKQENSMPVPSIEVNPQTTLLCSMLDLTDPNAVFLGKDSTFKLPDDAVDDDNDEVDDDNVDEDYDSEQSFVSISSSDQSYSFISTGNDSLLSMENDSFASIGNADEISADSEAAKDECKNDNINSEQKNIKVNEKSLDIILKPEKRLSLSEKLKKCPPSDSGSGSDSLNTSQIETNEDDAELAEIIAAQKEALNSSQDEVEDSEFADIMKAQKASSVSSQDEINSESEFAEIMTSQNANADKVKIGLFSATASGSDSEMVDSRNSSSSLDCKSLEINDDDAELEEMLKAQKQLRKSQLTNKVLEIAADNDEMEIQEIIAAQKKNQIVSDSFPDLDLDKPINQSSPIVNIEDRFVEDIPMDKAGQKRTDTPKTMQSPASKKFKRRNLDIYVSDEGSGEL